MSSLQERATISFYSWELRGRGYYLFDDTVAIEPPFAPFHPLIDSKAEYVDDGRRPSLLTRLRTLIDPSTEAPEETSSQEVECNAMVPVQHWAALVIEFPEDADIAPARMHQVLQQYSYSRNPIAFEILKRNDTIEVRLCASEYDIKRVEAQFKAYFPSAILTPTDPFDFGFDANREVAIADFGLDQECMLPIAMPESYDIDPLTSVIAVMDTASSSEPILLQIIIHGAKAPWSQAMKVAASDGRGGSFFPEFPELVNETQKKTTTSLFGAVIRIAAQGETDQRSRVLASDVIQSVSSATSSSYNRLVPLSNEGYPYDEHLTNVYFRSTNRPGCLLNTHELACLVHYPHKTVRSSLLASSTTKTKVAPAQVIEHGVYIGDNHHRGHDTPVHLDPVERLSHTHIIGATGMGKSTLMATMVLEDVVNGSGVALFDPHGDIVDDVVKRIPDHRKDDVILIDPSDIEYPLGFNLLEATSEAEKIVLTSDIVASFKQHATAWGDTMTAVLQNAVTTMLESSQGGTIIELKRFLLEPKYQTQYLKTVQDPGLLYYWKNEYPSLRKRITPLLTRIDTFLRSKTIRYMLAQRTGINITECINQKKVLLIKLSQGLIGEANSYLLGSLLLAKIHQAALGRQSMHKDAREPYYLYMDEFQNFVTPSIHHILSGARKYGLGLTLAHQELGQIVDAQLEQSILTNPSIRICFRLGDHDANRISRSFSFFDREDFEALSRGEALIRIGNSTNDCNITTQPLREIDDAEAEFIRSYIQEATRINYAMKRQEVEELLNSLYSIDTDIPESFTEAVQSQPHDEALREFQPPPDPEAVAVPETKPLETQKQEYLKQVTEEDQRTEHRLLQEYVRDLAQARGYAVTTEAKTNDGGRVDVALVKGTVSIAVEISVTNTIDYEVQNICKCLADGYTWVCMTSESDIHLKNIKKRLKGEISAKDMKRVHFGSPTTLTPFLDSKEPTPRKSEKRVRGYRVKSNLVDVNPTEAETREQKIQDIILNSMKKKSKK